MTLSASDVVLVRGTRSVLDGVSFRVDIGEVVGLLGANGAGKSSLLGVLAGELAAGQGEAALDRTPLSRVSTLMQARSRAVLPQRPSLQFDLGVAEVVAMGAYPFPELAPQTVQQLVRDAMRDADVAELAARAYLDLSGGEQQRVHLARVLVQCRCQREPGDARYLLLDEPTASQDPLHQQTVLKVAHDLAHLERVGVVVVLHDVNLAARWCDRIVLLGEGKVIVDGVPSDALTPAHLSRGYGVQAVVMPHPLHTGRLLVLV